jgi:hypothetical protein
MRGTSQSRRVGNPARAGKHDDLILSICIALFLSDQQTRNDRGGRWGFDERLLPQFGRNRIIPPLVVVQSHDQRRRLEGPRSGPFSLIRPCKKTAVRDAAVQHSREIEIYGAVESLSLQKQESHESRRRRKFGAEPIPQLQKNNKQFEAQCSAASNCECGGERHSAAINSSSNETDNIACANAFLIDRKRSS